VLDELLATLRGARVVDLERPRHAGAPVHPAHAPGYLYTLHRRHEPGLGEARTSASGTIVTAEHFGTHVDALCHQAEGLVMHGGCGVTPQVQTPAGFSELGAETIPPLVARGVLLDLAPGGRLPPGHAATAAELERAAEGLRIDPGDVVLVRTGNGRAWDDPDEYVRGPGVGADGARRLAQWRPLAVGADNHAVDVVGHVDPEVGSLPCHVLLLVREGVYLVENLALEELAATGAREFLFVCVPLKLRGVTGSPVRPLAVLA
jgi:kynurenine formamidase